MDEINFELTTMYVTEEVFPSDDIALIQQPEWTVSFLNNYSMDMPDKWYVTITMSYRLKDEGEQKVFLEMFNIYEISGDLDEEAKLEAMQLFLEQTSANLQGIWAAKSEKQPTLPLPPLIFPENYVEHLKQDIANGWI
jgi:hypothetical protein